MAIDLVGQHYEPGKSLSREWLVSGAQGTQGGMQGASSQNGPWSAIPSGAILTVGPNNIPTWISLDEPELAKPVTTPCPKVLEGWLLQTKKTLEQI